MRAKATGPRWVAVGVLFAAALASRSGAAATPAAAAPTNAPADDSDDERGVPRPPPSDQRTGHVTVAAGLSLLAPSGSISAGVPMSHLASSGPAFGGRAGVGLSRYVVLEAAGTYGLLGKPAGCSDCKARTLDLGLGLTYHLAQGVAVDPWISYGLGYRSQSFEGSAVRATLQGSAVSATYRGLDVARIAIGADFFPVPSFGFGPFLEIDAGTAISRPQPNAGGSSYAFVQLGLRIAIDPMRGPYTAPRAQAQVGTAR